MDFTSASSMYPGIRRVLATRGGEISLSPPNPPTLHVTQDQQRLIRLLLADMKKIKSTKKRSSMCRVDVIFDLAWMLHVKHYSDSKIGELKERVVKLLNEDKELSGLFDTIVPKRPWDAADGN